jgi:hypothetical protein
LSVARFTVLGMTEQTIPPSVPGLSHPALRWVRTARTGLDAASYARMTLAERVEVWASARALAPKARKSRSGGSPA